MCCKIGQFEKCKNTGCEWKKAFGKDCYTLNTERILSEIKQNEIKNKPTKTTCKPPEKRKIGRVVKDEIKYTEIKVVSFKVVKKEVEIKKVNPFEIDFSKITIASQDDWIKKIKVV